MLNEQLKKTLEKLQNYKLSKPVTVNDKTFEVLNVDFSSLDSYDLEKIAGLPECMGVETANPATFSKTYLLHIVARAAKINIHELRKFPIQDGTLLTIVAQAFLTSAVSEIIEI